MAGKAKAMLGEIFERGLPSVLMVDRFVLRRACRTTRDGHLEVDGEPPCLAANRNDLDGVPKEILLFMAFECFYESSGV